MLKINPNPVEDYLPLWKGELVFPIKGEEISSQTEWQEIALFTAVACGDPQRDGIDFFRRVLWWRRVVQRE